MARFACGEHGRSGAKLLCPHAARAFGTERPVKTTKMQTGDLLVPVVHLCDECLLIWAAAPDEQAKQTFLETFIPVCEKC